MTRIEVFPAADGWRFRVRASNGQVTAQSEGYTRRWTARRAALRFRDSFDRVSVPIRVVDR